jgi:hypothetical protein
MDKLTPNIGAQIRRAAAESGITQHDMMAPIVEALADLPDELDRRIDARLDKHETRLVQLLERAEKFTDADVQTISMHLVRNVDFKVQKRTAQFGMTMGAALVVGSLVLGALGAWWFFEHQNQNAISWGRAAMSQCTTVETGALCHPSIKVGPAPS